MTELSDDQIYERLHAARLALGDEPGETARGDTAIETARNALIVMQLGLLKAMDSNADRVEGVIYPDETPNGPSPRR